MMFNRSTPTILVSDDFYTDPDRVRSHALAQDFSADNRYFKGKRSSGVLYPYVKEEFERLLGVPISGWLNEPNGCFQLTSPDDPLVWHSDGQDYAGAIYLTKDDDQMGTSFWRNKTVGCRRPPQDTHEHAHVYSEHNLTHPDDWELVDRVGSVYNRLVLWDAKLIHSATQYRSERLVQLFFFNV